MRASDHDYAGRWFAYHQRGVLVIKHDGCPVVGRRIAMVKIHGGVVLGVDGTGRRRYHDYVLGSGVGLRGGRSSKRGCW